MIINILKIAFLLGFLGVHSFYLGKKKTGFITCGISSFLIGGIVKILFLFVLKNILAFLIPYFVIELLMIIVGISYLVRHDVTDGNGEFLE